MKRGSGAAERGRRRSRATSPITLLRRSVLIPAAKSHLAWIGLSRRVPPRPPPHRGLSPQTALVRIVRVSLSRTLSASRSSRNPCRSTPSGVYVPGGRAFYPSSLLMGVVPARVAGVPRVVVATPPRAWASSPELRWAARELGVDEVLLAGGAHGIAGLVSVARRREDRGPGQPLRRGGEAHRVGPRGRGHAGRSFRGAHRRVRRRGPVARRRGSPRAGRARPGRHCLLFTDSKALAADVRASVSRQLGVPRFGFFEGE